MAQQTMYPAMVNSPQTELSAAIDAVQVTVPVTDASKLPTAPNLATIGSDETAETILYTGKSGNTLTGVTRGYQGTAKAWTVGTKIARLFTASDWDSARSNIMDAASKTEAATAAGTASTLILRDSAGRAQVASPSAAADIARKDTVDAAITTAATDATTKANAVQTNLATHASASSAHGSTSSPTAGTIAQRDGSGGLFATAYSEGMRYRKTFTTTVGSVANQKMDLYFLGNVAGTLDVSVTGNVQGADATGRITKRFALCLYNGTIVSQSSKWVEAMGPIVSQVTISDITWDSTNSRWRIQIAILTSAANPISVGLDAHFTESAAMANIRDAAVSAVYTTDSTVLPSATSPWGEDSSTRSHLAVKKTSSQALATTVRTKVTFQSVDSDTLSEFDAANHRFVAKRSGWYLICAALSCDNPATNTLVLFAYKNGSSVRSIGAGPGTDVISGSTAVQLAAGDYLELYASVTGAQTLTNNGEYCNMTISRLP